MAVDPTSRRRTIAATACTNGSPNVMRLFAYKLTHDTGFAPNPFHGVCTLATCKSYIRLLKRKGDWIAGFTSAKLNHDTVGCERLVYLMRVAKKLPFETYPNEPRFAAKIPRQGADHCVERVGDNIYGIRDGVVFQVPNPFHQRNKLAEDTSGKFVLMAKTFAYFGSEPLVIPDELRPMVPHGVACHGVLTQDTAKAQAFVKFVLSKGKGIHARPTSWKNGDTSWKRRSSCG